MTVLNKWSEAKEFLSEIMLIKDSEKSEEIMIVWSFLRLKESLDEHSNIEFGSLPLYPEENEEKL